MAGYAAFEIGLGFSERPNSWPQSFYRRITAPSRESHETTQKTLKKVNLEVPSTGQEFLNYIDHLIQNTTVPRTRNKGNQIQILTPEEAQGMEADLVLLVGLDVGSWAMKSPRVPWLDAQSKLRLGMLHSDLTIRKGRHHLRHLLNSATTVIVFDSTKKKGAALVLLSPNGSLSCAKVGSFHCFKTLRVFSLNHPIKLEI